MATTPSTAARRTTATDTARTSPARSAASTYGVAKGVALVAVRVLDCSGSGSTVRRDRRHRLGDGEPRRRGAGRGEHEPRRRRRRPRSTPRCRTRSPTASATRSPPATATRAAARRTRATYSPARVSEAMTVGATDKTRHEGVVVELRHLRRLVRAGLSNHLGLVHERHGDEHDQRHVDGDAAHDRRRRALSPGEPRRIAGNRSDGPLRQHDEGRRQVVEDREQPPHSSPTTRKEPRARSAPSGIFATRDPLLRIPRLALKSSACTPQALARSVPCA